MSNFPSVPEIIYQQLGGNKFVVMTGVSNIQACASTLKMNLPRNKSRANRLEITLCGDDTYTLRFFRYAAPRFYKKTATFGNETIEELGKFEKIYNTDLQNVFTSVTGLYTNL